jgi:hypothetical protein
MPAKDPTSAGIDPLTLELTRLFHPRNDSWAEHFEWRAAEIAGRASIGRTTVRVLGMNEPDFLQVRSEFRRERAIE